MARETIDYLPKHANTLAMQMRLNVSNIRQAIELQHFGYDDLAQRLNVLPEAFGQWLSGDVIPVPHRLVRLSMILGIPFDDMILNEATPCSEPVVAYRKIAGKTTTSVEIETAKTKGRLLQPASKYTRYARDNSGRTAGLIGPNTSYAYLQQVASDLRKGFGVEQCAPIGPGNLIAKFQELGAILLPVMWGKREKHGNALHILHPDSGVTWIYLNIDANTCDFLFWMAHELAHVLTPQLAGTDEGEDFADALAQALLFPEESAASLYESLRGKNTGAVVNAFKAAASHHTISLYTVFKALNAYANAHGLPNYEKVNLYGAVKKFEKEFPSISQLIFGTDIPSAEKYIEETGRAFDTSAFAILRDYLRETPQGPGWLADVLDISFLDAKELFEVLSCAARTE